MNYTHDKNQIVFLKDADIISAFNEKNALNEVVLSNGIPSYDFFKKTYDELSTYDNSICAYLRDNVDVSVDNLSNLLKDTLLSTNGISVEVDRISAELSNELNRCELSVDGLSNYIDDLELSVNGLSVEVDRISSELSNELNKAELSINGLSIRVDDLSGEVKVLSTKLELSVDGLSTLVNNYKTGLSTSIDDLSVELNETSSYLCSQVHQIWKDIKGGVNYKGHLKGFEDLPNLPLCMIFGYHYNLVDTEGTHKLSASIPLNNGWLYNVTLTNGSYEVVDNPSFVLENNDYLIIHSKDNNVSCVEISDLNRDNIDIIEAVQDDYVRLAQLQSVSAWLENDYKNRILNLSTALSSNIDDLALSVSGLSVEAIRISSELSIELKNAELSVNGISAYVDTLELSVNGLSVEVDRISSEISTTLKLSVDELQRQVVSNDNDISTISSDLSVLQHHYDRTFHEKHYTRGTTVKDLSVDVLNVVDSEETDNQYTLQFLSGTLVLVKNVI